MSIEQLSEALKISRPFWGISLLQVPFLFDNQYQVNEVIFLASVLFGITSFGCEYNKYKYTNISEYKEYVALYKEFVSDIANMYSELGFKGDFATSVAYEFCVHNGIFSSKKVNRKWNEDPANILVKYCGGRVATGNFCCRHNASLLTDVLTEMDGLATNISVFTGNGDNRNQANHLVTGLLCNNKRLVVDPTHYGRIFLFDDKTRKRNKSITSVEGKKYRVISNEFSDETENKKRLGELMRYESFDDRWEILRIQREAVSEARKYFDEYEAFHEDEKPKILQLARLNDTVTSYGGKVKR